MTREAFWDLPFTPSTSTTGSCTCITQWRWVWMRGSGSVSFLCQPTTWMWWITPLSGRYGMDIQVSKQQWVFRDDITNCTRRRTHTLSISCLFVTSTSLPGLFWRLTSQHQTTTEGNFYLQMMATCTFSQEMVEWQETHLGNLGMPRTSDYRNKTL